MLIQMRCDYWDILAGRVRNASHRFVEISPDGGLTWRQYQLGGGGQTSADIKEVDWGDYHQPEGSVLKPPVTREYTRSGQLNCPSTGNISLKQKIEGSLCELVRQFSEGQSASAAVMQQLKNNYCAFNGNVVYKDTDPFKYDLPNSWSILLSPQMFYQFGENIEDWERIIKKSAWNMAGYRDDPHNAHNVFVKEQLWELCRFMQEKEIDVSYLNWVCDLYHSVPLFLEYTLLIILQIFSERCDSEQLKKRVKLMFMSYPLSPEKINLEATEKIGGISGMRLSKRYINFVKTMSMSHSLLGRLSQHRIHQQFHHQPAGNSRIIPEKLMSGDPAFLNVSKSTSYKPIIFDCASLRGREVESKIYRQMASGIKSEIRLICQNGMIGKYKILFFHWLAAHHMNDTISPIWLMRDYQCYGETAQPFRQSNLVVSDDCYYLETRLKLPPERIRDYFNQPSAVVLQNDDLLALLDEFLALIAT